MLTFLLGRSHSGKTQRVLDRLAALPPSDPAGVPAFAGPVHL